MYMNEEVIKIIDNIKKNISGKKLHESKTHISVVENYDKYLGDHELLRLSKLKDYIRMPKSKHIEKTILIGKSTYTVIINENKIHKYDPRLPRMKDIYYKDKICDESRAHQKYLMNNFTVYKGLGKQCEIGYLLLDTITYGDFSYSTIYNLDGSYHFCIRVFRKYNSVFIYSEEYVIGKNGERYFHILDFCGDVEKCVKNGILWKLNLLYVKDKENDPNLYSDVNMDVRYSIAYDDLKTRIKYIIKYEKIKNNEVLMSL